MVPRVVTGKEIGGWSEAGRETSQINSVQTLLEQETNPGDTEGTAHNKYFGFESHVVSVTTIFNFTWSMKEVKTTCECMGLAVFQ